jgi:hypothetical protein
MAGHAQTARRGIVAWLRSIPRSIFHQTADTAEHLSELGHGPEPWPEKTEFENPYAGWGPPGGARPRSRGEEPGRES